jgi:hypothetical protein
MREAGFLVRAMVSRYGADACSVETFGATSGTVLLFIIQVEDSLLL